MGRTAWFLAVGLLVLAGAEAAAQAPRKTNVLFIVADDLNTNLGCYGHPLVKSPHLDRLAEKGTRFERAYCQDPICNPSRTSFLSGRRPGSRTNDAPWLPGWFTQQGHLSISVGKVAHSYGPSAHAKWDQVEKGGAKRAVELLEQQKDRPFFLGVGLTHTHPGYQHTPNFLKLYPPERIAFDKEPADIRKNVPAVAFQNIDTRQLTDDERRLHMARYYASISTLDAEVGLLLSALDRLKLWENTVVVFTSDHGRHLGEHGGVYDKRTLFEESVRVPLIVVAPGKKAGADSSRLVELVDLYPTLAELCGLQPPGGLEGTCLVPLLQDPAREWKKAAFSFASANRGHTVRTDRFRYSQWSDEKTALLFDHQTDPREQVNLVGDPKHAATVAEMRRLLKEGWRAALPPMTAGDQSPKR